MCGMWHWGDFQDSHDGGAEVDILGHTLTHHTLPHHWAQNGNVEKTTAHNNFVGKTAQVSTPDVPAAKRGFTVRKAQNPTLEYKREFRSS